MESCPICKSDNWGKIDQIWIRCLTCGYLGTQIKERGCQICGEPLGKYSKPNAKICLNCKSERGVTDESEYPCQTVGCGNPLGKTPNPSMYCKQCTNEQKTWGIKDGHLWKAKAVEILKQQTSKKNLLAKLQSIYTDLTSHVLFNWITRQRKRGRLIRVKHGIYKADPDYKDKKIELKGIKTINIDPDNPQDSNIKITVVPSDKLQ